jgi:hypothetical protein
VFVALGIQHALCMRRVVLPSVACPTLQCFFPHYLLNGAILDNEIIEQKKVLL